MKNRNIAVLWPSAPPLPECLALRTQLLCWMCATLEECAIKHQKCLLLSSKKKLPNMLTVRSQLPLDMHTHAYTHTHSYIHKHAYMQTRTHFHISTRISSLLHTHTHTCKHKHISTHAHAHPLTHMRACTRMHPHTHARTHTHTHTHTLTLHHRQQGADADSGFHSPKGMKSSSFNSNKVSAERDRDGDWSTRQGGGPQQVAVKQCKILVYR